MSRRGPSRALALGCADGSVDGCDRLGPTGLWAAGAVFGAAWLPLSRQASLLSAILHCAAPSLQPSRHNAPLLPPQVLLLGGLLAGTAGLLDRAFDGQPAMLLFFVMVACPLAMNLIQVLDLPVCHVAADPAGAIGCDRQLLSLLLRMQRLEDDFAVCC